MSVYKRPNSYYWYYYLVVNGRKYRGTTKCTAKRAAMDFERIKLEEIQRELALQPVSGRTLVDLYEHAHSLWSHLRSYNSFYQTMLDSIRHDAISKIEIKSISTAILRDWVNSLLSRGNARSTVNQKLAVIRQLLQREQDDKALTLSPINWKSLRLARADVQHDKFFTTEQEQAIDNFIRSRGHDDIADFVTCLCDTGIRFSNLSALAVDNIDLTRGCIKLKNTKNGVLQVIPMTGRVRAILTKLVESIPLGETRIFPRITYSRVRKHFEKARDSLGIPAGIGYKLHAYRHTTGTRLAAAGVDVRTIQHWLGHQDIRQTARYVTVMPETMLDAAKKLETLF